MLKALAPQAQGGVSPLPAYPATEPLLFSATACHPLLRQRQWFRRRNFLWWCPPTPRIWSAYPSFSSPPRPGSRPGRRESSPRSAAYVAAQRPWKGLCETWQAPHCRSRPSSRIRTPRRGEAALLARSPRCRLCSCADHHRATVPGTSICLRGAAQKTYKYCVRAKTYT
jgi:hypothetical protein